MAYYKSLDDAKRYSNNDDYIEHIKQIKNPHALSKIYSDADKKNQHTIIAFMHLMGLGVQRNYTLAFEKFNLAIKNPTNPCPYAMNELGFMYLFGLGIPKNTKLAKYMFKKALTKNNYKVTCALINLAHMYCMGIYVKKDPQKGFKLLSMAIKKGDIYASCIMAVYTNDEKKSKELLENASEKSNNPLVRTYLECFRKHGLKGLRETLAKAISYWEECIKKDCNYPNFIDITVVKPLQDH